MSEIALGPWWCKAFSMPIYFDAQSSNSAVIEKGNHAYDLLNKNGKKKRKKKPVRSPFKNLYSIKQHNMIY